jgi:hypothetical protein
MAGVAFAVEGDGVGFATESYAASALYTTLASLSGALWRIRRARVGLKQPAMGRMRSPEWVSCYPLHETILKDLHSLRPHLTALKAKLQQPASCTI